MKKGFVMIMFFAVVLSVRGLQVEEVGSVELPRGYYYMFTENCDSFSVDLIRDEEGITFI